MSSIIRSREFILGIIIVISLFMYIPYFFQVPTFVSDVESNLLTTGVIILAFALLVGVFTITRRELARVNRKARGRPYSLWLIFLVWFMILTGVFLGNNSSAFLFFANSVVVPGDATIYSIMLFYMISAGARAFRMRDVESTLLMVVAFFVLMQQAPVAQYAWPGFTPIGAWLTDNLGMAITRSFMFVIAVGAIILAIRLITGREMGIVGITKGKEGS